MFPKNSYYFVNIERCAISDMKVPRNTNISCTNYTQLPIDTLIFIFYGDEFVIDDEAGVNRKQNKNCLHDVTNMMLSFSINLFA